MGVSSGLGTSEALGPVWPGPSLRATSNVGTAREPTAGTPGRAGASEALARGGEVEAVEVMG